MLYPIIAMVMLTFVVLIMLFLARVDSIKSGKVSLGSYQFLNRGDLPDNVLKTTRNHISLLEMPVLFYVACLVCLVLSLDSAIMLYSAWLYVFFRVLHTFIHIGSNNVQYRLYAFALSNLSLLILWIGIVLATL